MFEQVPPPPPSYRAIGKYQLVAEIGRGGMADVFLAITRAADGIDERVVIKQLRADVVEDEDFRAMFFDEARLAVRMWHPNVVRTLDVGKDGEHCFLVMEFIDGQPLSRIRKRALSRSPDGLPLGLQLRILSDVLGGLHYVHELTDADGEPLDIVHRDVTPQNVLVSYDGAVKVVDFGIALAASRLAQTRIGVVKGKLAFMSPEHARGEKVDRRSDIFSVGVMLWEALMGERLWGTQEDALIYGRLVTGDLPRCRPAKPGVDPELIAACEKATAVRPADRFRTAEEMKRALDAALARMGPMPSSIIVGNQVVELFADVRGEFQNTVKTELSRLRSRGESLSLPYLGGPTSDSVVAPFPIAPPPMAPSPMASYRAIPYGGSAHPAVAPADQPPLSSTLHAYASDPSARTSVVGERKPSSSMWGLMAAALVVVVGASAVVVSRQAARAERGLAPAVLVSQILPPRDEPAPPRESTSARLSVQATPAEARVSIDGLVLRSNPGSLDLAPGLHRVRVEAPGFFPVSRLVDLDGDRSVEYALRNEPPHEVRRAPEPFAPRKVARPKRELDHDDPYAL